MFNYKLQKYTATIWYIITNNQFNRRIIRNKIKETKFKNILKNKKFMCKQKSPIFKREFQYFFCFLFEIN